MSEIPYGERVYAAPAKARIVVVLLLVVAIVATMSRRILSLLVQAMQTDLGVTCTQLGLLRGFAFAITFTAPGVFLAAPPVAATGAAIAGCVPLYPAAAW